MATSKKLKKKQPEKLPLSPMLFQYLVGLYTLEQGSAAHYNVVLGDLVMDEASATLRDVDVTVTGRDGVSRRFVGYEVKHWTKKLDVSHVDSLVTKLKDMPAHRLQFRVYGTGYQEGGVPRHRSLRDQGVDITRRRAVSGPSSDEGPSLRVFQG
jgi:hypothetical protein